MSLVEIEPAMINPNEALCRVVDLHQTLEGSEILHGITLELNEGLTVINGESGSGKSTLFTCMSGLRQITSGEIHQGDVNLAILTEAELTEWRGQNIGIIYQKPNLLDGINVYQNIIGPQAMIKGHVDKDRLVEVTTRLRIFDKLQRNPATLSGGEQQRVAIARAIVGNPRIIFADEPTASLGTEDTEMVHELLRESVDKDGAAVVMVSHEEVFKQEFPPFADRIITLSDGAVKADRPNEPIYELGE